MTTIVYDHKNKQIACDSMLSADDVVMTIVAEKFKVAEDGSVWFFCGCPADNSELMKLSHNDRPEVTPDCNAIYAKDGKAYIVTFNSGYCMHTELECSHSIGSGWKFALSALDFECDAKKAVLFAADRDCHTGGKVRVFNVESGEFVND